LEAAKGVDGTVAAVVALPAADQAPLIGDRPHEGNIVLVGFVVVGNVVVSAGGAIVRVGSPETGFSVETHGFITIAVTDIEDLARIVSWLIVPHGAATAGFALVGVPVEGRSEEHTSELQSRENL